MVCYCGGGGDTCFPCPVDTPLAMVPYQITVSKSQKHLFHILHIVTLFLDCLGFAPLTVNLIYLKKDQVIHREEETSVDFVKDNVDSWSCDNIVREITRKLLGKIEPVVYKERIHTFGFWDDQMEKKSTQSCWKSYTAQTHNKWDYKQCGMEV